MSDKPSATANLSSAYAIGNSLTVANYGEVEKRSERRLATVIPSLDVKATLDPETPERDDLL